MSEQSSKLMVDDLDVRGKRVLVRVDFNVPLNDRHEITDDTRIQAALPTVKSLVKAGARVILMSHLGRPKGNVVPEMSLKPVAARLSLLLGAEVVMAPDSIGPEVESLAAGLTDGRVMLLENLRFHKGETDNDPDYAGNLARLGELYVNDAFGTAHRAHASTFGVAEQYDVRAAGYLMDKEIRYLGGVLTNPTRPLTAILGGAKISDKIEIIQTFLDLADSLLIGGGMAFTFYKAQGLEIGDSLLEADKVDLARELIDGLGDKAKLLLPLDVVIAKEIEPGTESRTVAADSIPAGWKGLDIGPRTVDAFAAEIGAANTIVWNGPMGVFEVADFAAGTMAVATAVAERSRAGAVSVVGGGDSIAAIKKSGVEGDISHISTGGGASLEFLSGRELPGISVLTDR
ncbi:phosphoglycerate kinase [candidate division KSB1 bacterium]